MLRLASSLALVLLLASTPAVGAQEGDSRQAAAVAVPAGSYPPLLVTGDGDVSVETFRLDAVAVTRGDFLAFVTTHPEWRRSEAPELFVGVDYLDAWRSDLDPGEGLDRPVTEVSWFAARAFCAAHGGRLPTTDEWEYAASLPEPGWDAADRPALHARFLALHQRRPRPDALPPVGRTVQNRLGVWDLHGVIHEWTVDFNNQMLTGAGRDDRGLDRELFCAAGSVGVPDPSDYAGFLRSAHRASLEGSRGGLLLGFRCVYPT